MQRQPCALIPWNGVSADLLVHNGSAPSLSRIWTILKEPNRAATCSGDSPFSILAFTVAPHFKSNSAQCSPFGIRAAMWRGVSRFLPPTNIYARHWNNRSSEVSNIEQYRVNKVSKIMWYYIAYEYSNQIQSCVASEFCPNKTFYPDPP